MRPADRLFQILLMLRHGRIVTAAALAEALSVSERTIYRDIADLVQSAPPSTAKPASATACAAATRYRR